MNIVEKTNINEWVINLGQKEEDSSVELLFVGDVALARRVGDLIDKNGITFPFSKLEGSMLNGSDAFVFNLECCMSDRGETWEPKPEFMRGKASYLSVFKNIQAKKYIANLANNHFLDYGEEAARDTVIELKKIKYDYIGVIERDEEYEPYILNINGIKVSLLAFSPCAHQIGPDSQIDIENTDQSHINKQIMNAKGKADIVIVSFHQGIEYSNYVDKKSRDISIKALDAGADCVICHHTHVIQGIERVGDRLIFHGIGNLILDIDESKRTAAEQTLALKVRISKNKIYQVQVIPILLNEYFQPYVVNGNSASSVIKNLNRLSNILRTKVGRQYGYQYANAIWFFSNIKSLLSMIERSGFSTTIKYYSKRISSKIRLRQK
jgi:poly-gamma-glutamate synthesis protein (capsule biosynthesis protein)